MDKRKGRRKSSLAKLATELNITESKKTPLSKDAEYQKSYHRINWAGMKPGEDVKVSDMTTEVIIDTRENEAQLMLFMNKFNNMINAGGESYGILRISYLWEGYVSITLTIEPEKLSELMIRLSALPEVEKVEDELFVRGEESGEGEKKFRDLPYPPAAKATNKIRVTLCESTDAE
jgi:hypothetical protein